MNQATENTLYNAALIQMQAADIEVEAATHRREAAKAWHEHTLRMIARIESNPDGDRGQTATTSACGAEGAGSIPAGHTTYEPAKPGPDGRGRHVLLPKDWDSMPVDSEPPRKWSDEQRKAVQAIHAVMVEAAPLEDGLALVVAEIAKYAHLFIEDGHFLGREWSEWRRLDTWLRRRSADMPSLIHMAERASFAYVASGKRFT